MTTSKTPLLIAVPKALFMAAFGLAWGGGLFWAGGGFSGAGEAPDQGYFPLRVVGLVIASVAFCGFVFQVMKMRAPERLKDRPTEAGEVSFDVDAALSNYINRRPPETLDAGGEARRAIPEKPAFGRKGARPDDGTAS